MNTLTKVKSESCNDINNTCLIIFKVPRKLRDEQATFKSILQEPRYGIAKKLLKQDILTIVDADYKTTKLSKVSPPMKPLSAILFVPLGSFY